MTGNLADYEALAFDLATTPEMLAALRKRLAQQRQDCPLFDTARFVRDMEQGYREMVRRVRAGEGARGLDI